MARTPLSDPELRAISRRLAAGESATTLSREFHTTRAAIYQAGGDTGGTRLQAQDEVERNAEAIDLAVWALKATANEPEWPADRSMHGSPVTKVVYENKNLGPQWVERTVIEVTPEYCAFTQRIDAERARRQKFAQGIAARYLATGELVVEGVRVDHPPVATVRAEALKMHA